MKMDANTILAMAEKSTQQIRSLPEVFGKDLAGKVAIVTGGATGLGYNVVNRLAEAGVRVVIASRKEMTGMKAEADFRARDFEVKWFQTDVAKVSDCYAVVDYAVAQYGRETPMAMNPDEVALVVLAMCTAMSDFIVGETIDVDGGSLLSYQAKPWSYTVAGCVPGPKQD